MNNCTFVGRVGADAELRTTGSGDKVLGFRFASDVGFGDRKQTLWIDGTIWGKRGEALEEYLVKGAQIVATGEVTLRTFEKRDGTSSSAIALRVNEIALVGGRPEGNNRDREPPADTGRPNRSSRRPPPRDEDLDDEIPF